MNRCHVWHHLSSYDSSLGLDIVVTLQLGNLAFGIGGIMLHSAKPIIGCDDLENAEIIAQVPQLHTHPPHREITHPQTLRSPISWEGQGKERRCFLQNCRLRSLGSASRSVPPSCASCVRRSVAIVRSWPSITATFERAASTICSQLAAPCEPLK